MNRMCALPLGANPSMAVPERHRPSRTLLIPRALRHQDQPSSDSPPPAALKSLLAAWPQMVGFTGGLLWAGSAHATKYQLGPLPGTSSGVVSDPPVITPPPTPSPPPAPVLEVPTLPDMPEIQMPTLSVPDMQASGVDLSILQDNPGAIVAGVAVLLLGIGVAVGLNSGPGKPSVKGASPATVMAILMEDVNTVFVDIRSSASVSESGKPQLKGIKGRARSLPYTQPGKEEGEIDVVADYGEKFAKQRGFTNTTTVVLFDSDGKRSPQAANEILKFLEFKTILYVNGGETAWKAADLGWQEPPKGFDFAIPKLPKLPELPALPEISVPEISVPDINVSGVASDVASGVAKGVTNVADKSKGAAGVGLVAGVVAATSFVIINEIDIILEVVGLFGGINLLARNFLFAKQRKKTVTELKSFVKEKIVPQEAGDDLKRIASSVINTSEIEEVTNELFSSVTKKNAPAEKKTVPVAKKDAPVAKKEAPVAKKEAPVAKKEAPAVKKDAPATSLKME